jgi:hypothetical protein
MGGIEDCKGRVWAYRDEENDASAWKSFQELLVLLRRIVSREALLS